MNRAQIEREIRKQQLVQESRRLREDFSVHAGGLRPVCMVADGAVAGGRWISAHPEVVVAFSVTFVVVQPKRALRWARKAFSVWRLWLRARTLVVRYLPT